jgi:hypothetical protein
MEFKVRSSNSDPAITAGIVAAEAESDRILVDNRGPWDGVSGWYLIAWASSRRDSSRPVKGIKPQVPHNFIGYFYKIK